MAFVLLAILELTTCALHAGLEFQSQILLLGLHQHSSVSVSMGRMLTSMKMDAIHAIQNAQPVPALETSRVCLAKVTQHFSKALAQAAVSAILGIMTRHLIVNLAMMTASPA
jgi:hypothetical protein